MKVKDFLQKHPDGNCNVVDIRISPQQNVTRFVFFEGWYETPRKKKYVSSFGIYFPEETIFVAGEQAA